MIPGTVHRATGNVPLRLSGGYLVHFEGREDDGRVRARLARGISWPVRTFDDVEDLYDYIDAALVVSGLRLDELDFPEGASVALVVRGHALIAPKGGTVLQPGDHVYVVVQPEDRPLIQLMFGQPEEG